MKRSLSNLRFLTSFLDHRCEPSPLGELPACNRHGLKAPEVFFHFSHLVFHETIPKCVDLGFYLRFFFSKTLFFFFLCFDAVDLGLYDCKRLRVFFVLFSVFVYEGSRG